MKPESKPLVITESLHTCANPGCFGGKVEWFMWQAGIRYCSPACSELAELAVKELGDDRKANGRGTYQGSRAS